MRVALIYNPVSGGGSGSAVAGRAADAFRVAGHEAVLAAWDSERGASDIAREAAESGADRVVAIGGDGTALEVAAGLLACRRKVPMAHVPCGTANVLALNLGIPGSPGAAITVAVNGVETRIDVGAVRRVDGAAGDHETDPAHPFLLSVGTGLHAVMVERAERAAKRRWGFLAYVGAGWRAIDDTPRTCYRLRLDAEQLEIDGTMVQVMNMGALLTPSWQLAPGISPVDGRLDVLVYRASNLREYLAVAAGVVRGRPAAESLVLQRSATRVLIEAEPPARVQRDGEIAGVTPVAIETRPRALAVVVPSGSRWAGAASDAVAR